MPHTPQLEYKLQGSIVTLKPQAPNLKLVNLSLLSFGSGAAAVGQSLTMQSDCVASQMRGNLKPRHDTGHT